MTLYLQYKYMDFKEWLCEVEGWHGTPGEDFDQFDKRKIGKEKRTSIGSLGFFFTPNENEANFYADISQRGGGTLQKWDIDIKNPYQMSFEEFEDLINWGSLPQQKYKSHAQAAKATKALKEELLKNGYDGVYILNSQGQIAEIVAFHPEQMTKISSGPGINVWEK